ncbi:MAG: SDR family NAD(P)-dependent oxidoreductase, partial [Demequina sp.]
MNAFDLTGRTAVVTGGARGLGDGITRALLAAGADVVVLARTAVPDELVDHAQSLGRTVDFEPCDLADEADIARSAEAVLNRHQIDVLVNNAGTQERHPAVDFPLEAWDRVLQVNLRAVVQRDGAWWIGWIEEVPGVNAQERTRDELVESLGSALREALESN